MFLNKSTFCFLCLQLILASVLNAFYDSISQILRKNVEKRALLDNLDAVFLAADELCDGGFVAFSFFVLIFLINIFFFSFCISSCFCTCFFFLFHTCSSLLISYLFFVVDFSIVFFVVILILALVFFFFSYYLIFVLLLISYLF